VDLKERVRNIIIELSYNSSMEVEKYAEKAFLHISKLSIQQSWNYNFASGPKKKNQRRFLIKRIHSFVQLITYRGDFKGM